jgi:hypothetical protein
MIWVSVGMFLSVVAKREQAPIKQVRDATIINLNSIFITCLPRRSFPLCSVNFDALWTSAQLSLYIIYSLAL